MAVSPGFKAELLSAIPSLRAFAVSLAQNADKADEKEIKKKKKR